MKKNIVFSMCASLLFLASCDYNEDNFPGYDELAIPKDVQNVELSLADGDYKKVAGLESNIKLAASKEDPSQQPWKLWAQTNILRKLHQRHGICLLILKVFILI